MEGYLTVKQAAEYLGYSTGGLQKLIDRSRKLMQNGMEPELRFAQGRKRGKILFRREWLDAFAKEVVEVPLVPVAKKKRKIGRIVPIDDRHGRGWTYFS